MTFNFQSQSRNKVHPLTAPEALGDQHTILLESSIRERYESRIAQLASVSGVELDYILIATLGPCGKASKKSKVLFLPPDGPLILRCHTDAKTRSSGQGSKEALERARLEEPGHCLPFLPCPALPGQAAGMELQAVRRC